MASAWALESAPVFGKVQVLAMVSEKAKVQELAQELALVLALVLAKVSAPVLGQVSA